MNVFNSQFLLCTDISIHIMKKLHIYFIHAKTLPDREVIINNFRAIVAKHSFKTIEIGSIRVITEHDPNDIQVELIQKSVDYSPLKEERVAYLNQLTKNIHINQLSNSLKHLKALETICECSSEDDLHLVLEDDILYENTMCDALENVIQKMQPEQGMVFLGLPAQTEIQKGTTTFHKVTDLFKVLPLIDSYLIRKSTAKILVENYLPIKFITNVQMQYLLTLHNIPAYQVVPNVFIDGSKYGVFTSTQTGNNMLVFNKDYAMLQTLANKSVLTKEEQALAEKIVSESPIRGHPDFLHMKAKYLTAAGKYKEAEQSFAEAYNGLIMKGSIVNHECTLLKDFIRLFSHLQTVS